ncbi:MAG: prolipoprotein diacylglyceryl transferase [Lawsonibacter sp.]|nr:prolipoprotein diacylglyceryl transferase [Lawsonibacter sp.]
MINTVSFPGLGLEFTLNRVAFTIPVLDRPVYWYGVIITSGLILAVFLCIRWGKRFGITEDNVIDMMLFAVPAALVAVRVYYVVFNLDIYRRPDGSLDWGAIVNYGDGGLAIYGAIISSAIVLLIFCRVKKISFLAFADLGVHGLFIGQLVGRWGNFMNVEAYGCATELPWRMCGPSIAAEVLRDGFVDQAGYEAILAGTLGVHPTFFYESVWNLAGLIMVYFVGKKRKFDGQCFLFYFFWYGLGRAWIEGLRTDSLYLFGWELFGAPVRVSQLFALVTGAAAGAVLVWALWKNRGEQRELFADRLAVQTAAEDETDKEE